MITTGDLFSGLGGTSQGIVQAGGALRWFANHNAEACTYHARNHPNALALVQDISELHWPTVEPVDWVHASPACQGDSECGQPARAGTGGNHRPDAAKLATRHARMRSTRWAVLAMADALRPRTITVENVPQMYQWQPFGAWCGVLESLGYVVRRHVLNPREFGGAQDRPRAIVTARLGEALDLKVRGNVDAASIESCLLPDDHPEHRWTEVGSKSDRMRWRVRKAQAEAGSRCFWNNVSESRGRPLGDVFPTSTTKSGSQWNLIDGERMRVIHPRELARSMSFPDHYAIPANRGLASLLIGNAMDVALSQSIAEQVAA